VLALAGGFADKVRQAPPYLLPLLVLSKRLHSIFVLRLFNDCFAAGLLFLAIYFYQHRMWTLGSIAFSLGVGVKMSLLLAAPGVGMVLLQAVGGQRLWRVGAIMGQLQVCTFKNWLLRQGPLTIWQVLLAFPFIAESPRGYFSRAFEFTRRFLFKWTVNWRFIGEDRFLSPEFSHTLLFSNLSILSIFAITRWTSPSGLTIPALVVGTIKPLPDRVANQISQRVTPTFVTTTILSSLAIGMLCARSLHYQFYAYIAWATPFLLWRAGLHPLLIYALWAAQEWAWNVYPSTNTSSRVVVACLAIQVLAVWWGTGGETPGARGHAVRADEHST
jgi:alpha-1,3-mannosyltransferase